MTPPDPADDPSEETASQPVSLDELSATFARLFAQQSPTTDPVEEPLAPSLDRELDPAATLDPPAVMCEDDSSEVTPQSILEAMLFVGDRENAPLTAEQAAQVMRGVEPEEVHQLVRQLNDRYAADGCPYTIASHEAGYRLVLRDEFARLRDRFIGRQRQTRLSQAAIDVLAIVAYNEPLAGDDVSRLRGAASGAVLSQLVRRQLLRIERPETEPRRPLYSTTRRFLELFGLESLSDLPQSQDLQP